VKASLIDIVTGCCICLHFVRHKLYLISLGVLISSQSVKLIFISSSWFSADSGKEHHSRPYSYKIVSWSCILRYLRNGINKQHCSPRKAM